MNGIENIATIVAVGFTIGVFTIPIKDNLYWKICEHLYIGFGLGYTIIIAMKALDTVLIRQLTQGNVLYIIPLILSLMLYSKYIKSINWVNRYPVALMIGVGSAISVRTLVDTMFIAQIKGTLINPFAAIGAQLGTPKTPINNIVIIVSVIMVVFFFVFTETKALRNPIIQKFRPLALLMMFTVFGNLMGNSHVRRTAILGARFFLCLQPSVLPYTVVFSLLAMASLYFSRE